MKNKIVNLLALLPLAACEPVDCLVAPRAACEMTFNIAGAVLATRASAAPTTWEQTVSSVRLFVFDASGALEATPTVNLSTLEATASVLAGEKTVWAVANAPDLGSPTLSGLSAKVSALSDNASGLVMVARTGVTVTDRCDVDLTLERLVDKVTLRSVTRNFTGDAAAYAASPMTITAAYLSNVAASSYYWDILGPADITSWYNKLGAHASAGSIEGFLYQSIGASLAQGATWPASVSDANEKVFYCYPYAGAFSASGGSWDYKHPTRLVLECDIAGTTTYYPVTLPKMERNKVYEGSVTLSGTGYTSPEGGESSDPSIDIDVDITVDSWDDVIVVNETI